MRPASRKTHPSHAPEVWSGRPGAWLFPSGEAGPREAATPRVAHRPCPATLGAQHWPRLSSREAVGWVLAVPGPRPSSCAGHCSPTFIHPACLAGLAQAWWHCSPGDQGPSGQVSPLPRPPQGTPGPQDPLAPLVCAPAPPPVLLEGPSAGSASRALFFLATPRVIWGSQFPNQGLNPSCGRGTRSPDRWATRSSL